MKSDEHVADAVLFVLALLFGAFVLGAVIGASAAGWYVGAAGDRRLEACEATRPRGGEL